MMNESNAEHDQPSPVPDRRFGDALRLGLGIALLVWAGWQVWVFTLRNSFFGGEWGALYLWNSGGQFGGLWNDFLALGRPWNPDWAAIPWLQLGFSAALIALYTAVGHAAVNCVEIYVPRLMRLALDYVFGLGILSILLELLTMAHGLYRVPVIVVIAAAWIFFWVWSYRLTLRRAKLSESEHLDPRVARISRVKLARAAFNESLLSLHGLPAKLCYAALLLLIAAITLLTFYHGALFAETYWDSLILYLGYGRMTFLQHAFPFKAVAQVGYGLGANYPHLYPLLGSTAATLWGEWFDVFNQLPPPWCGLLATLAVYYTALEITRNRLTAAALALLFRAPWNMIAYTTFASDYAVAICFTAVFLYLAYKYIASGLPGYFTLLTFIPAFAMHVNYLMGMLWLPWLITVIAVHWRPRYGDPPADDLPDVLDESPLISSQEYNFVVNKDTPGLFAFFHARFFRQVLLIALLAGSTWHVRNWALTGNPVYAFFHGVFGGVNYNEEVMASADREWTLNGDGIGRAAWELYKGSQLYANPMLDEMQLWRDWRAVSKSENLLWKWRASRLFWFKEPNWAFKLAPVLLAFALPGFVLWLLCCCAAVLFKPRCAGRSTTDADGHGRTSGRNSGWSGNASSAKEFGAAAPAPACASGCALARFDHALKFGAVLYSLVLAMLAFHYLLGDYYLYQILPMVPAYVLGIVFFMQYLSCRGSRAAFLILTILIGIFPGLPFALRGFKTPGVSILQGQIISPDQLFLLRHPGLYEDDVRRLRYDHDVELWNYVNTNCRGAVILTHENRHLVYDPSITLFHLDEPQLWPLYNLMGQDRKLGQDGRDGQDSQQAGTKSERDVSSPVLRTAATDELSKPQRDLLRALRDLEIRESDGHTLKRGIQYYLYIPNERQSPVNLRLGIQKLIGTPALTEVFKTMPYSLRYKPQLSEEDLRQCNRLFLINYPGYPR